MIDKKKYLIHIALSVSLFVLLTLVGGYSGHDVKFIASVVIYALITYLLIDKKVPFGIIVVYILVPTIFYGIIHLQAPLQTKVGLISSAGPLYGFLVGWLQHTRLNFASKSISIVLICCAVWIFFRGYDLWVHKINYGTFSGRQSKEIPTSIIGYNRYGQKIDYKDSIKALIVLDFWHTRCAICFDKFPKFQMLYDKYDSNDGVIFLAVNKPLESDTLHQSFETLRKRNYTFPNIVSFSDDIINSFSVTVYPTVVILNSKGRMIYKGDVENVESIIEEYIKSYQY